MKQTENNINHNRRIISSNNIKNNVEIINNNTVSSNNGSINNSRNGSPKTQVHYMSVPRNTSAPDDRSTNKHTGTLPQKVHHAYSPIALESVDDHPQPLSFHKKQQQTYVSCSPVSDQDNETGSINALNAMVQSISPLPTVRKRSYTHNKNKNINSKITMTSSKEHPYVKQMIIKKISDGSDKTNGRGQKIFKEFSKRHFFAYNPRFDLDILLVPPPMRAENLFKELRQDNDVVSENGSCVDYVMPRQCENGMNNSKIMEVQSPVHIHDINGGNNDIRSCDINEMYIDNNHSSSEDNHLVYGSYPDSNDYDCDGFKQEQILSPDNNCFNDLT